MRATPALSFRLRVDGAVVTGTHARSCRLSVQRSGVRVQGLEFRIRTGQGLGKRTLEATGLVFRGQGSEFRDQIAGFQG